MKRHFFALLALFPLAVAAQDNAWEINPDHTAKATATSDARYLAGAVPEVEGRVVFDTLIAAPGKSRQQLFDIVNKEMERMVGEEGQLDQSRLTVVEPAEGQVVGSFHEWLVFKNKPLNLDRTVFTYNLIAECSDGQLRLRLQRIIYLYDVERDPQTYRAEEWITDRWGLTKKQDKLARVSGKFRRKTIDRKDYLFNRFAKLIQQ